MANLPQPVRPADLMAAVATLLMIAFSLWLLFQMISRMSMCLRIRDTTARMRIGGDDDEDTGT